MSVQDVRQQVGSTPHRPQAVRALLADGSIVRMRELDASDTALVARLYGELAQ